MKSTTKINPKKSAKESSNYVDGFVFSVLRNDLDTYKRAAEAIAQIWKECGALGYYEYMGDDLKLEGTRSFPEFLGAKADEVILFGWVIFPSKKVRNEANKKVAIDPRISKIMDPLTTSSRLIFDVSKMVYGGFQSFIQV